MTFWTGKSVIVTGAGSGIGRALARAIADRGGRVWLSDIDADTAGEAAAEIGGQAVGVGLDVTDAEAFQAHVDEVVADHGHLDVLFNNAGIGIGGIAEDLDSSHFDRCLDVNVRGVTNGFVAAYRGMAERGSGIIVNTASAAGLLPIPAMAPYAMSKFAIVGLTRSLRLEAAERGVQVSALCPTAIDTPLLDKKNPPTTADIWVPDFREYVTAVGGAAYPVDRFVDYALRQIERNRGIIVAPFQARVRLAVARFFPELAEHMTRIEYRKALAQRAGNA